MFRFFKSEHKSAHFNVQILVQILESEHKSEHFNVQILVQILESEHKSEHFNVQILVQILESEHTSEHPNVHLIVQIWKSEPECAHVNVHIYFLFEQYKELFIFLSVCADKDTNLKKIRAQSSVVASISSVCVRMAPKQTSLKRPASKLETVIVVDGVDDKEDGEDLHLQRYVAKPFRTIMGEPYRD